MIRCSPVLWKNDGLIRSEEFFQNAPQEVAPPVLVSANTDQNDASVRLHLLRAVYAKVFEQRVGEGRSECCIERHRDLRDGWTRVRHTQDGV